MALKLNDIFRSTNLKGIISIDDTWNFNENSESCLIDIYDLPIQDRECLLDEIKACNSDVWEILNNCIIELSRIGFETKGKAKNKIYIYIDDEKTLSILKNFTDEHVKAVVDIIQKYGIGLQTSGIPSLKEILDVANEEKIPIRIYTDFTADDQTHFIESIKHLSKDDGYVFCIIDDQLGREKRAAEIIEVISKSSDLKNKTSTVLLTSDNNEENETYNSNIHIEFIKKESSGSAINISEKISIAYIKSLYRIMLSKLQSAKIEAIDSVFDSLYGQVDTAIYISRLAKYEGSTNFDMIHKWIQTKELLELEEKRILDIKSIIVLSNVLNNIDPNEDTIDKEYVDENELYSVDAYDTSINQLHKSIEVGDVFAINGSYFVLIGQECDLSIRTKGDRKTEVLEFVKAELYDSPSEIIKSQFSYENAIIAKFPVENATLKYIVVDCGKRYYGKPDIFDMCSYNDDGESKICLNQPLDFRIKALLPDGAVALYELIQKKYINYNCVKETIQTEQFDEFVKNISLTNKNNQVIGYGDFELSQDNVISYNVKRICRLRKHANLLHKMYLNYRGRQAEEAVCFSRCADVEYKLGDYNYIAKCLLSSKSSKNEPKHLHKRSWLVLAKNINEYLTCIGQQIIETDSEYLELQNNPTELQGLTFKRSYDNTNDCNVLEII